MMTDTDRPQVPRMITPTTPGAHPRPAWIRGLIVQPDGTVRDPGTALDAGEVHGPARVGIGSRRVGAGNVPA